MFMLTRLVGVGSLNVCFFLNASVQAGNNSYNTNDNVAKENAVFL